MRPPVDAPAAAALAALALAACSTHDPPFAHRPTAYPCTAHASEAGASPPLDQCTTDADCPAASACACFSAANANTSGNVCSVPGNCRVDADCPSGQVCSPSYAKTCAQPFQVTYACHTDADECTNDSDCGGRGKTPGIDQLCTFSPSAGKWVCAAFGCEG